MASASIKPTVVGPVAPAYDGRYGLAALVEGFAQEKSVSAVRVGSVAPVRKSPKAVARVTVPAREQRMVTRANALR